LVDGIDWIVTAFDELDESTKTIAGALAGLGVAWLLLNALFNFCKIFLSATKNTPNTKVLLLLIT
jgi:hypothetical protein